MVENPPQPRKRLSNPDVTVVLVEPEIPPNTGSIARMCAAAEIHLVLVGPLGFELTDARLKRAGLDYWPHVSWEHLPDTQRYIDELENLPFALFSSHATRDYTQTDARAGINLVFGKETAGLPKALLNRYKDKCYTIPMAGSGVRSLNLATAVGIVTYDHLRRIRRF